MRNPLFRSLTVQIDPKNTGEWMPCATVEDIKLKENWLVDAHVGFTGTTGQLADNHDIISFQAFSDSAVMETVEEKHAFRRHFEIGLNSTDGERIARIEDALNTVMEKLSHFDHHTEHELVNIEDNLKNLLGKLERKEEAVEERISKVEEVRRCC